MSNQRNKWGPNRKKTGYVNRIHGEQAADARFSEIAEDPKPRSPESETVEDFMKRGGEVRSYAYKEPPCWKMTFNGFSKYGKRSGKV